jgi:hypothetical protein
MITIDFTLFDAMLATGALEIQHKEIRTLMGFTGRLYGFNCHGYTYKYDPPLVECTTYEGNYRLSLILRVEHAVNSHGSKPILRLL